MNISFATIYNDYYKADKLFQLEACSLGQNVLLPGIMLKNKLEKMGHTVHTIDLFDIKDIDIFVFFDLGNNSILTLKGLMNLAKYFLKRKWRNDYLLKSIHYLKQKKFILIMQESPIICPCSANKKYHKYFDLIATWDHSIVDNIKYFDFYYPQVNTFRIKDTTFSEKKYITQICGYKRSNVKGELYSERIRAIRFFEKHNGFDLYGQGWPYKKYPSYVGSVEDKLSVLSKYKFAICFENAETVSGYITEKIFDCFFAKCVPIYLGAMDIEKYIPSNAFINFRMFSGYDELERYLNGIDEDRYNSIVKEGQRFISSKDFLNFFSVHSYVKRMTHLLLNDSNSVVSRKTTTRK